MVTTEGMTMNLVMSNIMAMLRDGHATPSKSFLAQRAEFRFSSHANIAWALLPLFVKPSHANIAWALLLR